MKANDEEDTPTLTPSLDIPVCPVRERWGSCVGEEVRPVEYEVDFGVDDG